jgi:hypothetical protein
MGWQCSSLTAFAGFTKPKHRQVSRNNTEKTPLLRAYSQENLYVMQDFGFLTIAVCEAAHSESRRQ